MPLVDEDELKSMSQDELEARKSEIQNETQRVIDATEAARDELKELEKRSRKGDPAAKAQISEQRETIRELQGDLRRLRVRRRAVMRYLQKTPSGGSTQTKKAGPNYGV